MTTILTFRNTNNLAKVLNLRKVIYHHICLDLIRCEKLTYPSNSQFEVKGVDPPPPHALLAAAGTLPAE